MTTRKLTAALAILLITAAAKSIRAEDQLTTTVTPVSSVAGSPVIVNNTATNGTIQVIYTYSGTSLPCGSGTFATFTLGLVDSAGTSGKTPTYPAGLSFSDVQNGGGGPVQISANPAGPFSVTGPGWNTTSTVTVTLPDCTKIDPAYDGEEVNGMLNEATGTAHLQTISGVLVKIKLSIPSTTSCLQAYSFETDNDGNLLTSITVNANKFNSVKSTNPGEISADALVANNCSQPRNFDLKVNLDPGWSTNPANNPANAVFTYNINGDVDPLTLGLFSSYGTATPQGESQSLCLTNISLPAGQSFLDVVHSQINGAPVSSLTPTAFNFSAVVYAPNTSCSGAVTISNPSTLPYTIK